MALHRSIIWAILLQYPGQGFTVQTQMLLTPSDHVCFPINAILVDHLITYVFVIWLPPLGHM